MEFLLKYTVYAIRLTRMKVCLKARKIQNKANAVRKAGQNLTKKRMNL
jgi:hypothetical protein